MGILSVRKLFLPKSHKNPTQIPSLLGKETWTYNWLKRYIYQKSSLPHCHFIQVGSQYLGHKVPFILTSKNNIKKPPF